MSDTNGLLRNVQEATTRRNQAGNRRTRVAGRNRLRPDLLALEDRRLMATFVVTDPADPLTGGVPTPNTLRWAVEQADVATTPSTIKFELGSTPATITLTQGELELSNTTESIRITGLGADDLTVSGGGASRVFQIDPSVTASISGLTVSGGSASFAGGGLYNQGMATLTGLNVHRQLRRLSWRRPFQLRDGNTHRLHDPRQFRPNFWDRIRRRRRRRRGKRRHSDPYRLHHQWQQRL